MPFETQCLQRKIAQKLFGAPNLKDEKDVSKNFPNSRLVGNLSRLRQLKKIQATQDSARKPFSGCIMSIPLASIMSRKIYSEVRRSDCH